MKNLLKDSRGMALVVVIFIVSILLTLTGAGLLFSQLDLKMTGNHKLGTQALEVADTGVQHALAVIPVGTTFPYSSFAEVVSSTIHPSVSGFSYSVEAVNTAADMQAVLTSISQGPNGTKKVVMAYIGRGTFGLGATSLPGSVADSTETNFSGDTFTISGIDNCGAAPAVPGIAVTDPALAEEISNSDTSDGGLASDQMDNVAGVGGSPSVVTISPPSMTVSQYADAYLALSHVDLTGGNYSGSDNWGTSSTPAITRITGDATITGTIDGYGVLIVDGTLDIAGNFSFHGLVITRGDIQIQVNGNAGIYGALMIDESTVQDAGYELDVRGNAHIQYDSCALATADGWIPLPKAAKLLAWHEVM